MVRVGIAGWRAAPWSSGLIAPLAGCSLMQRVMARPGRAMSWGFLIDWRASLEATVGREVAQTLNSYQIVGDKNLSGEWQGDGGRDWTACLPWSS